MISAFDIKDVNKSASSINPEKLLWLNQHYIKHAENKSLSKPLTDLFEVMGVDISNGPELEDLIEVQKQRTETLKEMAEQSLFFYNDFEEYDANAAKKHLRPVILEPLKQLYDSLNSLDVWDNNHIKSTIDKTANELEIKMGKLAQPLRVAVTGAGVSPSIDDTLTIVRAGKKLGAATKGH